MKRYDITIKKRERGPEAKPECTVEIEAAYNETSGSAWGSITLRDV